MQKQTAILMSFAIIIAGHTAAYGIVRETAPCTGRTVAADGQSGTDTYTINTPDFHRGGGIHLGFPSVQDNIYSYVLSVPKGRFIENVTYKCEGNACPWCYNPGPNQPGHEYDLWVKYSSDRTSAEVRRQYGGRPVKNIYTVQWHIAQVIPPVSPVATITSTVVRRAELTFSDVPSYGGSVTAVDPKLNKRKTQPLDRNGTSTHAATQMGIACSLVGITYSQERDRIIVPNGQDYTFSATGTLMNVKFYP
jgi:hypothetical protein